MRPRSALAPAERADLRDLTSAALHVLVLAVAVVPGSVPWAGPVLLTLSLEHGLGVHLADLAVVALGLLVPVEALRRGVLPVLARTLLPDRPARRAPRPAAVRLAAAR